MANKCFISLHRVVSGDVSTNYQPATVLVYAIVVNDQNEAVVNPNPESGVPNEFTPYLTLSYSSTLASLKAAAQAAVITNYGFTPTFVWLDDKGLL